MTKTKQESSVKKYFDYDSTKYADDRYPSEATTCDQYSYLTRKSEVLRMLDVYGNVGRVLDIGCGPGIYIKDLLARKWNVNGIDISTGMVEKAAAIASALPNAKQAHFSIGVVTDLKFDTSYFDAVLCIGVVSYIEDLDRGLIEISRVVKSGGYVIFQISNAVSPLELFVRVKRLLNPVLKLLRRPDVDDMLRENIVLRPYRASRFEELCETHDLHKVDWRYYDYRFPPLDKFFPDLSLYIGKKLRGLGRSSILGWLGASYLVAMRKGGNLGMETRIK